MTRAVPWTDIPARTRRGGGEHGRTGIARRPDGRGVDAADSTALSPDCRLSLLEGADLAGLLYRVATEALDDPRLSGESWACRAACANGHGPADPEFGCVHAALFQRLGFGSHSTQNAPQMATPGRIRRATLRVKLCVAAQGSAALSIGVIDNLSNTCSNVP